MFSLLVLVAELIGSLVGFGSSTLLAPVAFSFIDFRVALVVLAWTHIAGMVTRFARLHEHVDRHIVVFFGAGSVAGSMLGAMGNGWVAVPTLKLFLGVSLFVYGCVVTVRPIHWKIRNQWILVIAGVGAGLISGLVGTGGVVQGAVLSATHLKKKVYLSTAALISIVVDVTRVAVYHQTDTLPHISLSFLLPVLLMAVVGSLIGVQAAHYIPQRMFKRLIGIVLLVVGASLFWQTLIAHI